MLISESYSSNSIQWLLGEVTNLRPRIHKDDYILRRFLDDTTSYAESSYAGSIVSDDDFEKMNSSDEELEPQKKPSTTTRKPSRRTSGNGASPSTQQQSQDYSPTTGGPSAAPKASWLSNPSAQPPRSTTTNTAVEYQRGVPPVGPPRTSSNQKHLDIPNATALIAADGRRPNSRNAQTGDGSQESTGSGRSAASHQVYSTDPEILDDPAATASKAARLRRQAQKSPQTAQPHRTRSHWETRSTQAAMAIQGRSQSEMGGSSSTPNGLSKEGSEILNRVVVSTPEVDIERKRERERMDEATTGLNVVTSEGVNDAGRGGSRSRHDNTATSSKRKKNTKFGEYFLGNTLGEGEFGKVKMGWKQEGAVQVRNTILSLFQWILTSF
jgi:protein-serine/threonine kinase